MGNFVITVERGFGSGGKTIAHEVADRLGIPCYDSEIVKMASDWSGLSTELFDKMNAKQRGKSISRYVDKLDEGMLAVMGYRFAGTIKDENLFLYEAQIIKGLAQTESCVILGYAANYILRKYPNVLSVNIQAPRHVCVKEIADRFVSSEDEAASLVAEIDMQRSGFYHYFTGKEWINYKDFDLILNSHRLGREFCAKEIIDLLNDKIKSKETGKLD
jgi:cytidylate kinase